jgi:hypothetical protein
MVYTSYDREGQYHLDFCETYAQNPKKLNQLKWLKKKKKNLNESSDIAYVKYSFFKVFQGGNLNTLPDKGKCILLRLIFV